MATVFSTATLGLRVDTSQFNKQLKAADVTTSKALADMVRSASAFDDRWKDLTKGIKDTKRIISGILISQGFYTLMNALTEGAAAALEFSESMETAAVSLEYFVDSAAGTEEAAAKVTAYLRQVNAFAASTPFNTDEVLSLSKYMQSVGIAMSQTQSVLSVITDTAAATGASNEQLERITYALGQMLTKGRLANEEIRQLANANIPIYEILQEEMGLTGEEISKIGNNWVDASEAVVAILNGLNKRYDGAADKIADTLTGLTDTIVDDAKIIADTAFEGIYNKVTSGAGTLRDTLDYWRELVTEKGAIGLANEITLDIDPTGQLGTQILTTIGYLRQLKTSFVELYQEAAPLLSVLGSAFQTSLNAGIVTLRSFIQVGNKFIAFLNKGGKGAETFATSIAKLYVAYKATKFISLFGEAAAKAGLAAYEAANGILSLIPATSSATGSILSLASAVAGLISYLLIAASLFGSFKSLSGSLSSDSIDSSWDDAYAEYEAKLDAYNKAVDQYSENYQDSYTTISGSSSSSDDDDDDSSSSSSGGGGASDWVAAFDEVYDIPDDSTGSYQDAVLDDLSDIIKLLTPSFTFPDLSTVELPEYPTFSLDDVYENSAEGVTDALSEYITPTAIALLATGLGNFASRLKSTKATAKKTIEQGEVGSYSKKSAKALDAMSKNLDNVQDDLEVIMKDLRRDAQVIQYDGGTDSYRKFDITLNRLTKRLDAISEAAASIEDATGTVAVNSTQQRKLQATQQEADRLERHRLAAEEASLRQRKASAVGQDTTSINTRLTEIEKRYEDLGTTRYTATFDTADDFEKALDSVGDRLFKQVAKVNETLGRLSSASAVEAGDDALLRELLDTVTETEAIYDEFVTKFGVSAAAQQSIGGRAIMYLRSFGTTFKSSLNKVHKKLESYAALVGAAGTDTGAVKAVKSTLGDLRVDIRAAAKAANESTEGLAKISPDSVAGKRAELEAEQAANAAKKAAAKPAAPAAPAKKPVPTTEPNELPGRLANAAVQRSNIAGAEQEANPQLTMYRAARDIKAENLEARKELLEGDYKQAEELAAQAADLRKKIDELEAIVEPTEEQLAALKGLNQQLAAVRKSIKDNNAAITADQAAVDRLTTDVQQLDARIAYIVNPTTAAPQMRPANVMEAERQLAESLVATPKDLDVHKDVYKAWLAQQSKNAVIGATGFDPKLFGAFATAMSTAAQGISDYSVNFAQLITGQRGFGSVGLLQDVAAAQLPSSTASMLAARGTALEKYAVNAANIALSGYGAEVYKGGYAYAEGLVTQIDAFIGKLDVLIPGISKYIGADVKTVGATVIEAINRNAEKVADGVYKADATLLLQLGRTDNFYELAAQSYAFTGSKGDQAAIFFNADFDYGEEVAEEFQAFLETRYGNGTAYSEAASASGRIFSEDAFSLAKKVAGATDYTFEQYESEVLIPFLAESRKMHMADLAKAVTVVSLDYSKALKSIDVPGLVKAYNTTMAMMAMLSRASGEAFSQMVDANGLLSNIISIVGSNGALRTGTIPIGAALQKYPTKSKSGRAWLSALLGSDVNIKRGSIPTSLRTSVTEAVEEYNRAAADGVAAAAEAFVARMQPLVDAIDALRTGRRLEDKELIAVLGNLAKNPAAYDNELKLLSTAMHNLVNVPSEISKLNSSFRTVNNIINSIKQRVAAGVSVDGQQLRTLADSYKTLVAQLGISNNVQVQRIGNVIQRAVDAGSSADLTGLLSAMEQLPFSFGNMKDFAGNLAATLLQYAEDGMLMLSDDVKAFLGRVRDDYSGKVLKPIAEEIKQDIIAPAKVLIVDIESAGLYKNGQAPMPLQISTLDPETGDIKSVYITSGNLAVDRANIATLSATNTKVNGKVVLSDVAKEWDEVGITAENLATAYASPNHAGVSSKGVPFEVMTLDDWYKWVEANYGKGVGMTGWNATSTGGFDYNVLSDYGMPKELFQPVDDLMDRFTNMVKRVTGVEKKFKLVDAYSIVTGQAAEGAHNATTDVRMANAVREAMEDGTLEGILKGQFQPVGDLMDRFTNMVKRVTGVETKFTLADAYNIVSIATGQDAEGAHNDITDVRMANAVREAMEDGTLEGILERYPLAVANDAADVAINKAEMTVASGSLQGSADELDKNILMRAGRTAPKDTVELLQDASNMYSDAVAKVGVENANGKLATEAVKASAESITEEAVEAAEAVAEEVTAATKVAAEEAAAAVKATEEVVAEAVEEAAESTTLKAAAKNLVDDFVEQVKNFSSNTSKYLKNLFSGSSDKNIFGRINDFFDTVFTGNVARTASLGYADAMDAWLKAASDLQTAAADGVTEIYEAAYTAYEKATFNAYRAIVEKVNDTLGGRGTATTLTDFITGNKIPYDTEYFAAYFDEDGVLRTFSEQLTLYGEELTNRLATAISSEDEVAASIIRRFTAATDIVDTLDAYGYSAKMLGIASNVSLQKAGKAILEAVANGDDATEAITEFAKTYAKVASANAPDIAKSARKLVKELSEAGTDELPKIIDAFNSVFGDSVVIMDRVSGEVLTAGDRAAKLLSEAADSLTEGIGDYAKKVLFASIGEFSTMDVIGIGLDMLFEAVQLDQVQKEAGQRIYASLSESTQEMFDSANIDLSDTLGDAIYRGVQTAFEQSVVTTLVSNGLATAVMSGLGAILATTPAGWIGALVATGIGVGTNLVYNALGGNTDEYKYFDNWLQAVNTGEYVDKDALYEALGAAGYTSDQIAAAYEDANQAAREDAWYNILAALDTSSSLENQNLEKLLYGSMYYTSTGGVAGGGGGSSSGDLLAAILPSADDGTSYKNLQSSTLRVAEALGMFGDDIELSTDTYGRLIVSADDMDAALQQISSVLGVDVTTGESVTYRSVDTGKKLDKIYYTLEADGKAIEYNNSNIDALTEAVKAVGETGMSASDFAAGILTIIESSPALSEAYAAKYGAEFTEAQSILPEFLSYYNEQNGTHYTVEDLDNSGQTRAFLNEMVAAFNAVKESAFQLAELQSQYNSANRSVLRGDTTTVVGAFSTDTWRQELIDELAGMGLSFNSTQSGYTVLNTDYETLLENLAGVRLEIGSLDVTTDEADILAKAGIQIVGDGTVVAMKADNEGTAGSSRDLTIGEGWLSENTESKLNAAGVSFDYTNGSTEIDANTVAENLTAALFKLSLPDGVAAGDVQEELAGLGNFDTDGYFSITNQDVLSGTTSISEYLATLTSGEIPEAVKENLMAIDTLLKNGAAGFKQYGNSITEWADAVIVNTGLESNELTDELAEYFEKVGIAVVEGDDGLQLVISNLGDHWKDGISSITADEFSSLGDDVVTSLEDLGVKFTEVGNSVLVDTSELFTKAPEEIVSAFISQPELWEQIPETVRAMLEETGIVTEDGLLEIQTKLASGAVSFGDGWIASVDQFGVDSNGRLKHWFDQAGLNTENGLLQITEAAEDANVGPQLDGTVVIPFEQLPEEIQEALGGTESALKGKKVVLGEATATAMSSMLSVLSGTVETVQGDADDISGALSQIATDLTNTIETAFTKLSVLESVQARLKGKQYTTGVTVLDKYGNEYYVTYNKNGEAISYTNANTGISQTDSPEFYADGGIAEGTVVAGELGTEMAILPSGSTALLDAGLYDFPAGTQILNAEDTAAVRKYVGDRPTLRKYADGSTVLETEDVAKSPSITDKLDSSTEIIAIAIKNAALTLAENESDIVKQLSLMSTSLTEAIADNASTISSSMYSSSSSSSSSASDLLDEATDYGGSAYDKAMMSTAELASIAAIRAAAEAGETTWQEAHEFAENIRSKYGYSGGASGLKYITGSASGSLVTKDALYRAGELGLNEAIIPLERPSIMQYVGSTIASYMPDYTSELAYAVGMRNAGITQPRTPTYEPDINGLVAGVAQSVLESVLPAVATVGSSDERTPVYVGTLIADDHGLKQLERKLYKIRMTEEARRS